MKDTSVVPSAYNRGVANIFGLVFFEYKFVYTLNFSFRHTWF